MSITLEDLLKLSPEEIWALNERPTSQQLRDKQQIYYDDVNEGMELPKYIYRPTPTHLFRWSAAIENFHRMHYDLDFGLNHDNNPSILVHGSWKQSVGPQYLKDWTLPSGWPWKAQFEHRAMLVPGDVLIMNDPWLATGHLLDLTIVRPVFHKGRLAGFVAAVAHHMDIGGRKTTPASTEIYEEGLYLPVLKLL